MRFSEFQSTVESIDQDIIAAALIARDKAETDGSNKMPMTLFINMLKNSETPLSYNTLVSAYESNPKLKNIIQQFNKDEVVFVDANPADGTDSIEQPVGDVPPEKKVQQMAAKAAAKREDINGLGEVAPPGREKQVKALKKKFDDPGAPYAIAWAQHNKSGKPKKKS